MSASLAYSKLDALPALDMDSDRLARACGQGPSFSARSSFSQDDTDVSIWDKRPRTPERKGQTPSSMQHGSPLRWEYPDFSGLGLGLGRPSPASPRGMRPRPHSVRVPARVSPVPPIPHRPRSFSQPASIPVFAPSSPRPVLRSLQAVLDRDNVQLGDCLDVQGLLERWAIHRRLRSAAALESLAGQEGVTDKTFGSPVSVAVKCASMSTVLGGYQHPIPWVVYACVEELNRTGIYQPGLFRAVPHRSRLEKLISGFDCALSSSKSDFDFESPCPPCAPTASSTRASLRKESMADVCALLKSYLDSLPDPLLHENITSALHRLCVVPSDKREQDKLGCEYHESNGYFHVPPSIAHRPSAACTHARTRSDPVSPKSLSPLSMTPSEKRSADLSLESAQVHIAQHLLRLAAPPLCSVFAYLCAFFTQLPLSPDNGITLEDVSRMFGRSLAGGPVSTRNAVLMWLLERWPRIADGLFSICSADAADEGEDVAPSMYPQYAPGPAITPNTDDTTQPLDSTPHISYPVPEVLTIAARRGSAVSLDGAESVFTASTAESDDGVHDVRTPFSGEFPPLPLPAVREYEFEPEWEEPPSVHPMLNGGVENGLIALSSVQAHSPGTSSKAILALDSDAFFDSFKRPANSNSRTDSLRSSSPHSPPPDSEYESPSPSAVCSRSASRAPGVSDDAASRHPADSPLSILKKLGVRESSPHRSPSARKTSTTAHYRAVSDGDPAPNGPVEH